MNSWLNRGSEADAVRSTAGGEKSLEDYTFSGSGQPGEASLAEQAAQSAAASTFEVALHALRATPLGRRTAICCCSAMLCAAVNNAQEMNWCGKQR